MRKIEREMGRMMVAAIVSIWVIPMSILVNRIVPDPYMVKRLHLFLSLSAHFTSFLLTCSPCGAGWDIPHPTGAAVLPWGLQILGSHDHYPTWPVSSFLFFSFFSLSLSVVEWMNLIFLSLKLDKMRSGFLFWIHVRLRMGANFPSNLNCLAE